jgi:peptide-methionine (S)-S-oxide reductase
MRILGIVFSRVTVAAALLLAGAVVVVWAWRKEAASMGSTDGSGRTHEQLRRAADEGTYRKATFAAGCFWGVEAAFRRVKGVVSTAVGYTGGHLDNPTYEDVCSHRTGHAEAVEVIFDPQQVSYGSLLETFWRIHDPTTPDRQGPDVGSQYRSAIFFHDAEQEAAARKSKAAAEVSGRFSRPIVTQIAAATRFWRAEEYHQQYLEKRGRATCRPG